MLVQPVYSARLYLLPYQMINFGSDGLEVFQFNLVHPDWIRQLIILIVGFESIFSILGMHDIVRK